jgi:uncharacterized protein YodC (DUF2158 family)
VAKEQIKPGDVVKLQIEGPAMVVLRTGPDSTGQPGADCVWFDKNWQRQVGTFPLASLVPVSAPAAGEAS